MLVELRNLCCARRFIIFMPQNPGNYPLSADFDTLCLCFVG
jgi:hypothetical protein